CGDDALHPTYTDEPRHLPDHGLAPRLAYNVADEENSHLLGYVGITAFTDDRDLDLAGIRQLLLDLAGQVAGQDGAFYVRDRILLHDHPNLPAGLDGVGLVTARVVHGPLLPLLESLDVCLDISPPRPLPS